nr:hypothetical protein Iba_chr14bCG10320 [Ipomoea batatas]
MREGGNQTVVAAVEAKMTATVGWLQWRNSDGMKNKARELPRTKTEDLPPVKEEEWNPNFDYKRWNEDYERLKALFWAEHGDYESRDKSRISGTPTTAQSGSSTKSRGSSSKGKKKK